MGKPPLLQFAIICLRLGKPTKRSKWFVMNHVTKTLGLMLGAKVASPNFKPNMMISTMGSQPKTDWCFFVRNVTCWSVPQRQSLVV